MMMTAPIRKPAQSRRLRPPRGAARHSLIDFTGSRVCLHSCRLQAEANHLHGGGFFAYAPCRTSGRSTCAACGRCGVFPSWNCGSGCMSSRTCRPWDCEIVSLVKCRVKRLLAVVLNAVSADIRQGSSSTGCDFTRSPKVFVRSVAPVLLYERLRASVH